MLSSCVSLILFDDELAAFADVDTGGQSLGTGGHGTNQTSADVVDVARRLLSNDGVDARVVGGLHDEQSLRQAAGVPLDVAFHLQFRRAVDRGSVEDADAVAHLQAVALRGYDADGALQRELVDAREAGAAVGRFGSIAAVVCLFLSCTAVAQSEEVINKVYSFQG